MDCIIKIVTGSKEARELTLSDINSINNLKKLNLKKDKYYTIYRGLSFSNRAEYIKFQEKLNREEPKYESWTKNINIAKKYATSYKGSDISDMNEKQSKAITLFKKREKYPVYKGIILKAIVQHKDVLVDVEMAKKKHIDDLRELEEYNEDEVIACVKHFEIIKMYSNYNITTSENVSQELFEAIIQNDEKYYNYILFNRLREIDEKTKQIFFDKLISEIDKKFIIVDTGKKYTRLMKICYKREEDLKYYNTILKLANSIKRTEDFINFMKKKIKEEIDYLNILEKKQKDFILSYKDNKEIIGFYS